MWILLLLAAAPAAPWPPPLLSQTGLFSGAPEAIARVNRPFTPQYPLWSDGAQKRRWIRLPPKSSIDASNPEAWVFPPGTRFWKEFTFGGKKVETRLLEKTARGEWIFATYRWNEEQTDAALVGPEGLRGAAEISPGVFHDLPSHADCRACHEGKGRDAVLGFGALQLSADRDPHAPNREEPAPGSLDLPALLRERRLRRAPADWADRQPVIAASSPNARAALGYLHGNCWGCHNEQDPVSSVGLSLRASLLARHESEQPAVRTGLGVRSRFQTPGVDPEQRQRIFPGDPEKSALVYRVRSRHPLRQMPPLGTKIVDAAALSLLNRWVTETDISGQAN